MIGTGNDFEMVRAKANEMNLLNKVVFFTGLLEGEELVDAFYDSDFNLLFSNYENIPVVISESLICGKPVLSTNVGGISEHIDASNGILVERNDEDALFIALNNMINTLDKYDSNIIREKALNKYSYISVGEMLVKIYNSVLNQ